MDLLRVPVARPPGLAFLELLHEELLAVLPLGHRLLERGVADGLDLPDLAQERFILVRRPGAPGIYQNLILACRAAGFEPLVVTEVAHMLTNINLVAAGAGISVVPASMREINLNQVGYCRLRATPRADRAADAGLPCRQSLAGAGQLHRCQPPAARRRDRSGSAVASRQAQGAGASRYASNCATCPSRATPGRRRMTKSNEPAIARSGNSRTSRPAANSASINGCRPSAIPAPAIAAASAALKVWNRTIVAFASGPQPSSASQVDQSFSGLAPWSSCNSVCRSRSSGWPDGRRSDGLHTGETVSLNSSRSPSAPHPPRPLSLPTLPPARAPSRVGTQDRQIEPLAQHVRRVVLDGAQLPLHRRMQRGKRRQQRRQPKRRHRPVGGDRQHRPPPLSRTASHAAPS